MTTIASVCNRAVAFTTRESTVDDLLEILADELSELAKIVAREQSHEAVTRK